MRWLKLVLCLVLSHSMFSQAPALIPYQAIASNGAGQPLANAPVTVRFTIHIGSSSGTAMWQEVQALQTSALGLFTAQMGSVNSLESLNWSSGNRFLQVELDMGSGYIDLGTEQLLSVPYALYAANVESRVSMTGDTLLMGRNAGVVIPGISAANHGNVTTGTTLHTCGAPDVHNSNLKYGSMVDQEGQSYKTIIIGPFEIMAENLNTSTYRNGDIINTGLTNNQWQTVNSGAWTYYNNDASYECPYGKWYNWFAATEPVGICPLGWHVPNEQEWDLLLTVLDPITPAGEVGNVSGGPMKSVGTTYWVSPNDYATNSSGFSGLPNGNRGMNGSYYSIGLNSNWWSADQYNSQEAWFISMSNTGLENGHYHVDKNVGYPVRCMRD